MAKLMQKRFPSQDMDRFMVRLPDGMRGKIARAAEAAKRTMNAEIVARLEASFAEETDPSLRAPSVELASLKKELAALKENVELLWDAHFSHSHSGGDRAEGAGDASVKPPKARAVKA